MKVQCQLQGTFHRIQLSGTDSIAVSLVDLIREVQAVATQNRRRSPQLLRQSFGLNFLPEPVLINLLQAQGVIRESEYQVPSLQLIHPIKSNLKSQVANTYRYQFTCPEATLILTPDDSQLPFWTANDSEKSGIYTVTLEQPNYPGLSDEFAQNIWQQAINSWQTLPENRKIHIALQSLDSNTFRLITSQLQIWISLPDLSLDLRAAITFLRLGGNDTSALSEPAKSLVQQYQSTYSLPIIQLPQKLSPDEIPPAQGLLIDKRRNRSILKTIISTARKFLLISSYIIEDESLTELICKKSQELSQGVWILTDLRNEIIDRIDAQVSDNVSLRTEYQRSHERNKACLKMLLDANIPIRSGAFHLKTYISEQYAYLGSCNLTGGSLDFNVEAGIISRNNSIHTQLINLFRQFWQQRSRDEIIPTLNSNGFHLRSIHRSSQEEYQTYPSLLTLSRYKKDLIEKLRNFRGQVQIYSRSFQPSPEIEQYLRLLDTRIFVDSQMRVKYSTFNIKQIDNLHAKITLLGDEVAYIGGINFNFSNSALSLNDLMYKTTNYREITQIRQNITSLYS
ncbi:hypothetical protein PI95_004550 [Hassallia byssoidea VB512170]|uniref:PLD phosphodiesterase domain-containing protein n=1 Tax=Hassallia byssoidea VB512170 TaxID=1304833 RepID=A0A846H5I8_9CYAN|nr:phospholipase D-like domain-containing protein [Hassalia byssoidea]NEU71861.1 hypothetical protein [Hassalia byssoidea VB512170]